MNVDNVRTDCVHFDSKDLWWKEEYLCKWRVHSECPSTCSCYVQEKIIELLEKEEVKN